MFESQVEWSVPPLVNFEGSPLWVESQCISADYKRQNDGSDFEGDYNLTSPLEPDHEESSDLTAKLATILMTLWDPDTLWQAPDRIEIPQGCRIREDLSVEEKFGTKFSGI